MVLDGYKKMTIYADYENVNFLDQMHLNTVSQKKTIYFLQYILRNMFVLRQVN